MKPERDETNPSNKSLVSLGELAASLAPFSRVDRQDEAWTESPEMIATKAILEILHHDSKLMRLSNLLTSVFPTEERMTGSLLFVGLRKWWCVRSSRQRAGIGC